MSEPALRLVNDDGVDHETERLRRDLAAAKRMLQAAFDEKKVLEDAMAKFHRENAQLKARLVRQENEDAQDELVNAIFEFWKLMTFHPRAKLGADRVKAINARTREGYTPRDFFKAIVGAAFDSYVSEKGKRFDDLALICRSSEKMDAKIENFYMVPDVRAMVADAEAIQHATALMDLERRRANDA